MFLGSPPHGLIETDGEPNSVEIAQAKDFVPIVAGGLRRAGKQVLSSLTETSRLGGLPAVRATVTYECSDIKYLLIDVIALSPDKATVFEVRLSTTPTYMEQDARFFDRFLSAWRFTGVPHAH